VIKLKEMQNITIGIVAAMQIEAEAISSRLQNLKIVKRGYHTFYEGKIDGITVAVTLSGVGKVNAAFASAVLIELYKPFAIISTGIAGGLGRLGLFDVLIADKAVQHDMSTAPLGDERGYISGINRVYIDTSEDINEILKKSLPLAKIGTIATGDQFIASDTDATDIVSAFDASACDMESAAVAQVAYMSGVKIGIIRVISDSGGDGGEEIYKRFAQRASEINGTAVIATIKQLAKDAAK